MLNWFNRRLNRPKRPLELNDTNDILQHCVSVVDSQIGQRSENQDNYLLVKPDSSSHYLHNECKTNGQHIHWQQDIYRLAVADGMGGHQEGRQISQALIQQLMQLVPQINSCRLKKNLNRIHQKLRTQFATTEENSAGTTLVMADVYKDGRTVIANVGDSRAYLWRNNRWSCLTYDQSLHEYNWRDEELDDEIYQQIVRTKQTLSQAMGYGSFGLIRDRDGSKPLQFSQKLRLDLSDDLAVEKQSHADIFTLKLQRGDAILLASDGLWQAQTIQKTEDILLPPPEQLNNQDKLRHYFLDNIIKSGSRDNITAVMLWSVLDE
jgi:serine/threonine protein phosphatase PrpC